jgi:hypothetical protein
LVILPFSQRQANENFLLFSFFPYMISRLFLEAVVLELLWEGLMGVVGGRLRVEKKSKEN